MPSSTFCSSSTTSENAVFWTSFFFFLPLPGIRSVILERLTKIPPRAVCSVRPLARNASRAGPGQSAPRQGGFHFVQGCGQLLPQVELVAQVFVRVLFQPGIG